LTPSEAALEYAEGVCAGDILAGRYVKLACKRFIDDLDKQDDPDYPYYFHPESANHVVEFMEKMPHTKGKWAAKKETLKLQPWQKFIECNVFGWLKKSDDNRRFRQSYEEIPRKNGKSIRMAARGLYLFCADSEPGSEVYSGATGERQAYEVYRPAWEMVRRTEGLRDRFDIEQAGNPKNPGTMYIVSDMSKFETLIGKPGDGANVHGAIIDEYHEHSDDHMVDCMATGMASRLQGLLSIITTAGGDLGSACYEMRGDMIRILEGTVEDDSVFAIIYGIDEDDAWDDEASLVKANPNYGVSVYPDFLHAQLKQARRSASKQNAYRTKHLNQWVGARTAWMNMLAWQRQKADFTLEDMGRARCWMACDLASKKDLAAMALLFDCGDKYRAITRFYCPESALEENDTYQNFATAGHLIVTPGNMTDYAFIEEDIKDIAKKVNLQDAAFDNWQANYLMTRLMNTSIRVIDYNQTVKNMSEPMKEVEARVLARTLEHDGNPVLTFCLGNVSAKLDAKENVYPRKSNEHDPKCKIDGAVALIMAMGRAISEQDATPASIGFA
jgi:phage terminase large subunit-like protein